jgi:hypothetical protein
MENPFLHLITVLAAKMCTNSNEHSMYIRLFLHWIEWDDNQIGGTR